MKTVTVREFYHSAGLVDGLSKGQQLVVTCKGKPKFVVTKAERPRMTRQLAEQRSVSSGVGPINSAQFLAKLKK